ncbi:MAG: Secretion system C-terminal sorting domain, partial [Bacteroidota bacterium]
TYWLDNDSSQVLFHFIKFEGETSGKIVFEYWPMAQTVNLLEPQKREIAKAFPNPVLDQLFIPLSSLEAAELTLYNSQGQCVARSGQISLKNGSAPVISMPFEHLPSGRYVLKTAQNGQIHSQIIIKL